MCTLPELLRHATNGVSPLKGIIGEKLQTVSSSPIPPGCSCYGFHLAKDELAPPLNRIDAKFIHVVVHNPEKEITCYPIQRESGEKIYAVSFDFSGCFMALFEHGGILYAAHITTSSDQSVNGRAAFTTLIRGGITNYIVYNPFEGMEDHTAGIIEFTGFDSFHCYSFGQNNHSLRKREVNKNDAHVLTETAHPRPQSRCVLF
ncbi:hypothetical protein [uncultured Akkermansia sp.]|uniref:hypothetical protein n=1 Tax=uncultured Akkermansia sp. TaxID=512294 RepID=UPI00265CFA76|nr:hypothetical protein [uncultured Akkermansia sp.]